MVADRLNAGSTDAGSTDSEIAISIRSVSKKFVLETNRASSVKEAFLRRAKTSDNDFWALKDVSFDIPKGSFFGIIGHNGSGKSTILRLMAGIHMPTSGSIVTSGRISALLELGSGFHPDLTGRENIFLNGAMLGLNKQQMTEAIDEIIEFSGIGDFIDSPVKIYSSGMQVRLGFAVAVHVEPEILLVDEVLAVGDEEFQRKCLDHIHTLRRKGVTIVLVAHSPQLMQTMCDEVAWLDHGQLQTVGPAIDSVGAYIRQVNSAENKRLVEEQAAEAEAAEQAEKERADAEQASAEEEKSKPAPPAIEADRRGSGEIRVTRIEYLDGDGDGEQIPAASTGDPLTIRVRFKAAELIEDPRFGFAIYTDAGAHLGASNDQLGGVVQPPIQPGLGYVDIIMARLILLPGTHYLTIGIYNSDHSHCYDSWHMARKLVVHQGSSHEYAGMVELGVSFSTATPDESR